MDNRSTGADARSPSPMIDERNMAELLQQIKQMAPFYTPEWRFRPEDPDPGTALSLLFAHLLEGNIRRLNQVPHKSFLTFLNRFQIGLAPARPALAQVTFHLTEGAPEPVLVEKGTALAVAVPGDPEPVLFETVQPLLLTPAKLTDMLTVSPEQDRIVRLASAGALSSLSPDGSGVALFGGEGQNEQEHVMYIRHDTLFLLRHPAYLELRIHHSRHAHAADEAVQLLTDPSRVRWEYYSGGAWIPFDRVYGQGPLIRLVKLSRMSIDPVELQGLNGSWIRSRAVSMGRQGEAPLGKVQLDRIEMKSEFAAAGDEEGIPPDRLYFNDMQVDPERCLPFGDMFAQFGLFYVSSQEALSKRGALISIRFDAEFTPYRLLPDRPPQIQWKPIMKRHEIEKTEIPDPVTIAAVMWEYWNGSSWVTLPVEAQAKKLFGEPWEGVEARELTFLCPDDLREVFVNAEENYWIRGRIVQISNAYSPNAIYYAPVISNVRLRFGYDRPAITPQTLLLLNNLDWSERASEAQTGSVPFRPFAALEGRSPALWFGFDSPPEQGPISLYMHLSPRRVAERDKPVMEWEYMKKAGSEVVWSSLSAADDTNGFTQSGSVRFIGPHDMVRAVRFGAARYWIRAVNRDGRYDRAEEARHAPRALSVLPNTTLVVQQQTVSNEYPRRVEVLDRAEEQLTDYYVLSRTPLLSEEVWVDETGMLSGDEISALEQTGAPVEIIRDSGQQVMQVWVRYEPVSQLLRSGPEDRHYVMDRATGRLAFGDGRNGRKPAGAGEEHVRVTYATGGGVRGNVPAGAMMSLQSSIAYIDRVTSPYPAAGGCDAGSVEEAIVRGPKRFTHRGRAVTCEDFEWLTREAHPNVAKVKCLPNVNVKLEKEPGSLCVVVLPKSGTDGAHFLELKRTVEASLLRRAASALAFPGRLQVIGPAFLEIGVQAVVWVKHMDDVVPVEREISRKLNMFLDPLVGNADGRGWNIGQIVHSSMFYALLKSVGPVVHIPQLALDVVKLEDGMRTEWNPEKIGDVPHGVVAAGRHRIRVEVKK
ncbi:hypothetical protein PAESOLCIP111_03975 [Paenibacillus solanacearum]|uniref:Baseplate protein J-like domain-containing protein n=1 Tax=Paenibacillus solanacearum TaxID=2048548 RepID=A0A916K7B0_9BACL|nr:putative baseplate assembly protein [Paenibacillus solanacearum]CAG7638769.1 hypothetical protein PAESOLCIP111_03975 [Paenibacillus solanacearum]